MRDRRVTLVTDGSSDVVLLPFLRWLFVRTVGSVPERLEWADLRGRTGRRSSLRERVERALGLCPCDLVLVHRDAERARPETRHREVERALRGLDVPHVAVVPVRMQEAWLLHDEHAIRTAAGRPSGREALDLPRPSQVERVADPKQVLHRALRVAHGGGRRRQDRFDVGRAVHRLADIIDDWSPVLELEAGRRLAGDLAAAARRLGWSPP